MSILLHIFAIILLLVFISGFGLLEKKGWLRYLGLMCSFLGLFLFLPFAICYTYLKINPTWYPNNSTSSSSTSEITVYENQKDLQKRIEEREKRSKRIEAFTVSKDFVEKQLKCPSTSDFPWYDDSFVTELDNGSYRVSAYVDAQNSFGAMIRNKYYCIVYPIREGQWRLISIFISEN